MGKDVVSGGHDFREREKPRKKVLEEIRVKRAANGGFVARHHFDNSGPGSGYHEPEDNVFSNGAEMLAHVAKHMGISGASKPAAVEKAEG